MKIIALFLGLMFIATCGFTQEPSKVRLFTRQTDAGLVFTLSWETPIKTEYQIQGRSIVLRFDRPLGNAELEMLERRWPNLVEHVSHGYDSLLIRAAQAVMYTVTRSNNEVTVSLEPVIVESESSASAEEATVQQNRLQVLHAKMLFESGRVDESQATLKKLLNEHPNNLDALSELANSEQRLGKWREATALYDRVLLLNPSSVDHKRAKVELMHLYGDRVGLNTTYSYVKDNDEQIITRVNARKVLDKQWSLNIGAENRLLQIDSVHRANGNLESFDGSRNYAQIEFGYDTAQAHYVAAALLLNPDSIGMRALLTLGPPMKKTQFKLAYQEPDISYVESIVDYATRDQIAVSHERELSARLSGLVGVSYNNYNISNDRGVGKSIAVDLSVDYVFRSAVTGPTITGGYFLEAEYVDKLERRLDSLGQPFNPLPVVDRELHGIGLSLENRWATNFTYTANVGYVFDRFNENGPFAGFNLSYLPKQDIEFRLPLSYSIASGRGTGDYVFTAGLFFIWYL